MNREHPLGSTETTATKGRHSRFNLSPYLVLVGCVFVPACSSDGDPNVANTADAGETSASRDAAVDEDAAAPSDIDASDEPGTSSRGGSSSSRDASAASSSEEAGVASSSGVSASSASGVDATSSSGASGEVASSESTSEVVSASTSAAPTNSDALSSSAAPTSSDGHTTSLEVTSDSGSVDPDSASSGDAGLVQPSVAPDLTDVAGFELVPCNIDANVVRAEKISTVGVATFGTDLADAERAFIQFGTASEYRLEAPVDWDAAAHRTLLLGMPSNTEVHYRVVVVKGDQACVGADASFDTGALDPDGPADFTPLRGQSPETPAPGFIVTEQGQWAYVVNKEGQVVWWFRFPTTLTRAVLSWDAKYLVVRDMGPFNATTGGNIHRVDMDGENLMRLDVIGGHHHDLTVIPDGIAYIGKTTAGACDSLITAKIDGTDSAALVDLGIVFDKFDVGEQAISQERCHVNYVRYYSDTQSFSVSDREKDAIAFFSSDGALLGSIGAQPKTATPNHVLAEGADSDAKSPWRVQHGHDLYAPNKLLVWSNGVFQGGQSRMLHYTIHGATASLDWQYTGAGTSPTLSDVQHLPNGHFLATNSSSGSVHEVDSAQKLVVAFTGLSRGYSNHRTTLYGPPSGR